VILRSLRGRLERLESAPALRPEPRLELRFAHLRKILPPSYTGERHVVVRHGFPGLRSDTECEVSEIEGPGPELRFDFDRPTMLLYLVPSPKPVEAFSVDANGVVHHV
jgi:hypothetical protein